MPLSINLSQQSWSPRRPSVSSPSHSTNSSNATYIAAHPPSLKSKGKDRYLPHMDSDPFGFGHRLGHNNDHLDSKSSDSSPSATAYASSSHSAPLHPNIQQHSASLPSRHRISILSVASDALGFRKKIGFVSRKKPNAPSLSHNKVIDIKNATVASTIGGTTAHKDYECEERERLRDVAAQSIGLDPELLHSSNLDNRSFLDSPQSPAPSAPMPPFPATLVALLPFTELSATLPKFTPPSSLLVYALAKQWKLRTIVLTSHSPSQKTHVHLFKGASKDEKEVERLEVTEDSVIYVAEEQVGGRGNVIKLAGKDVSLRQSGTTAEGSLRTMWFLQIKDPAESHRWIAAIKNAVLRQRYEPVRAGLEGGNEPKGDMDVMLSMHLQRIVSTHPINSSTAISPPSQLIPTSSSRIFSGARPRSPSVEGSPTLTHPPGHTEDSFSAAGTSLLTMLRTKSSADSSSSPSHSLPLPPSHVPAQASSSSTTPGANTPPAPSFPLQGALTFSLQPPPRKTKHTVTTTPATLIHEPQGMYKQVSGNRSVAGNFGIPSRNTGDDTSRETPPVSPNSVSLSTNSGCEASSPVEAHVVNSSSPGGGSVPTDKLSQSTAITKRWSRQGVLPKQLTPPTGPPPSIPPSPENNHRISVESSVSISFTHVIDRSSSSSSSNLHRHPRTPIRPISGSSLSPTFWKRGSGSSTLSGSSINTSDSQGRSHMRSPFGGVYFPSSFGSIVSNGGSSRPMSLSVNGSSPVVHIGTAKRRSMPPPRPAPNFAPPPAPTVQESMFGFAPLTTPAPGPQKSFRSSVAQRALRLSLTSPKPPPSSALPPRPDEGTFVQGHRRSSSSGRSDIHPIPSPSLRPSAQHSSSPKSLSIRQRLRILSTPPAQSSSSSIPSIQVSTLDLNDDERRRPSHALFRDTPADCDFVALSPPPPRKACKSHGARPEIFDIEQSAFEEREESKLVALSQRGSVVSLGFVTT
ncbi:hypothetical protein EV363DRAFT_1324489 [Boletus edulis]|nr:hypothetical protein EV363DRAFT_1324489 [Boletus edulis]